MTTVDNLPESFKVLATKHQQAQGNEPDGSVDLVKAFDWKQSPEGGEFWWEVYNGNFHEAISKNQSDQVMCMLTYGSDYGQFTSPEEDITALFSDKGEFGKLVMKVFSYEKRKDVLIHSNKTPEQSMAETKAKYKKK